MGDVYITRLLFLSERAIAYSATAVLPADVWAHTRTDSSDYIALIALAWKGSNTKGYCLALKVPLYYFLS